jgi:hypothetical protein
VRLVHGRDRPAPDARRPRVHRARQPADPPEPGNGVPGLGPGSPSRRATWLSRSTPGRAPSGSSSGTGTRRSAGRSTRCCARRGSGSFARPSRLRTRTRTPNT